MTIIIFLVGTEQNLVSSGVFTVAELYTYARSESLYKQVLVTFTDIFKSYLETLSFANLESIFGHTQNIFHLAFYTLPWPL